MHKVSFEPLNAESHDAAARWLGWTHVSNKTCIYLQQINGTEKIIADPLLWDFHMSDQTLKNVFNLILPL